jgi:glycosyltransferase involved in cell wall biosynthesis
MPQLRVGVVSDILLKERMGMERYADSVFRHVDLDRVELVGIFREETCSKPHLSETVSLSRTQDTAAFVPGPVDNVLTVNGLGLDVLFSPTQNTPPYFWFADAPRAVTIHGAAEFELPPEKHRQPSRRKTWAYRSLNHRLDTVVTPSESSRRNVSAHYGIDSDRIQVVYHGISDDFSLVERTTSASIVDRYGLPGSYLLAVGRTQPKKNVPNLLRAYAQYRRAGFDCPLVVIGGESWGHDAALAVIDEHDIGDHVHFAPFIETSDLPSVYSHADLTCYVSLHEGFGFPLLESMACGTPVVTSDRYSMPEVGGDAVRLVDPTDPDEIGDTLVELSTDGSLYNRLVELGRQRASTFTWERSSDEHTRIFERLAR